MKKLEVRFTRGPDEAWPVGVLAEDRGRTYFEYSPEFLARGLNLSPLRLPFQPELFTHNDRDFGPLPGLFDDSLPDGWGLLLMDRYFRQRRMNLMDVTPLDRLAWLGTRTMGALTYHPPTDRQGADERTFLLHELARQSAEIFAGEAVEVLPQLLRAGGSAGGARPKVLVGVRGDDLISGAEDLPEGYSHWIIKFKAGQDTPDVGPMEYAYALMAGAAGIPLPPVRLFKTAEGDCFFGVRRFDREGNRRIHVHTFGNLIQSNFRIPSADYADLLKATALLTRNHQDVLQAFRRMVFNVMAHNRDDHVKNFAFLLDDVAGEWKLAPAYDLILSRGPGGWHTMTVAGEGKKPGRVHMLRLAEQAGIAPRQAAAMMDETEAAVNRWDDFATQAGVSDEGRKLVSASLSTHTM